MTSFSQLPPADALTPDDILPIGQHVIDHVTGQSRYITRAIHPGALFGLDFKAVDVGGDLSGSTVVPTGTSTPRTMPDVAAAALGSRPATGDASEATVIATGTTAARTMAVRAAEDVHVLDYAGADPTGSTDSTIAIQAAIYAASGRKVILPPGNFKVGTLNITSGTSLVGVGRNSTTLTPAASGITLLNVAAGNTSVEKIGFLTGTEDIAIHLTSVANGIYLNELAFRQSAVGILIDSSGYVDINMCMFWNFVISSGVDIKVTGGTLEGSIRSCVFSGSKGAVGIQLKNSGDFVLIDNNIIFRDRALEMTPGSGQNIDSVWSIGCFFDSSTTGNGVFIEPTGTGQVARCGFTRCWMSSHMNGVHINSVIDGNVDGIDFDGCHMFLNSNNGVDVSGGKNIRVNGGLFAQNAGSGLAFVGTNGFSVTNAKIGSCAGLNANYYGIYTGGAADHYIITGNDVTGNTIVAISDGATGTHKVVANNLTS
jgi:hypothetical protein